MITPSDDVLEPAVTEETGESAVFLSLIVPVYNVAATITPCMVSALSQLPVDCEILCVDDGSTDDSVARIVAVAQQYPAQAKRLRHLAQSNQGLSVARNTGIAAARGRYIGLLDSDDVLRPGYFQRMRDVIEGQPDVSIICFQATRWRPASRGVTHELLPVHAGAATIHPGRVSDHDALATNFARGRWFAWARVYERSMFEGFAFSPGYKYQDMLLLPELYRRARTIVNLDEVYVDYRIHDDSITARGDASTLAHLDDIIAYYRRASAELPARLDALRHLVVLSALESVFHAERRMHGTGAAIRALRVRQRQAGSLSVGATLLRHARRLTSRSALLQISPQAYHGAGILARGLRGRR